MNNGTINRLKKGTPIRHNGKVYKYWGTSTNGGHNHHVCYVFFDKENNVLELSLKDVLDYYNNEERTSV